MVVFEKRNLYYLLILMYNFINIWGIKLIKFCKSCFFCFKEEKKLYRFLMFLYFEDNYINCIRFIISLFRKVLCKIKLL